jgi:predicted dehydrogenase
MWTRFFPCIKRARELIDEGAIGEVVSVHADFGFKCEDSDTSRMFNKSLGMTYVNRDDPLITCAE